MVLIRNNFQPYQIEPTQPNQLKKRPSPTTDSLQKKPTNDDDTFDLLQDEASLVLEFQGLCCEDALHVVLASLVVLQAQSVELVKDLAHVRVPLDAAVTIKQHLYRQTQFLNV